VEKGGSKSVVFCGQSTYKIFSCVFEISYLKQKGALSEAQRLAFRSKGDREIPDTRPAKILDKLNGSCARRLVTGVNSGGKKGL